MTEIDRCECTGQCGGAHTLLDPVDGRCIEKKGTRPARYGANLVALKAVRLADETRLAFCGRCREGVERQERLF
jgi:hypothetical protein